MESQASVRFIGKPWDTSPWLACKFIHGSVFLCNDTDLGNKNKNCLCTSCINAWTHVNSKLHGYQFMCFMLHFDQCLQL